MFGIGDKAFALNAQTLLNDVVWGKRGDTYWTLIYIQPLSYDISFTGSLGWFSYVKEGHYVGTHDSFAGAQCASGRSFVVTAVMPAPNQSAQPV